MERRGPKLKGPVTDKEWQVLEKLLEIGCTLNEIAMAFSCHIDTIETRVKEQYGIKFSELFQQKRELSKISLRRAQWRKALEKGGNVTMLIWLGKQFLGQTDKMQNFEDPDLKGQGSLSIEQIEQSMRERTERFSKLKLRNRDVPQNGIDESEMQRIRDQHGANGARAQGAIS